MADKKLLRNAFSGCAGQRPSGPGLPMQPEGADNGEISNIAVVTCKFQARRAPGLPSGTP